MANAFTDVQIGTVVRIKESASVRKEFLRRYGLVVSAAPPLVRFCRDGEAFHFISEDFEIMPKGRSPIWNDEQSEILGWTHLKDEAERKIRVGDVVRVSNEMLHVDGRFGMVLRVSGDEQDITVDLKRELMLFRASSLELMPDGSEPIWSSDGFEITGWTNPKDGAWLAANGLAPAPERDTSLLTRKQLARALFDRRLEKEAMRFVEPRSQGENINTAYQKDPRKILDAMWVWSGMCATCLYHEKSHGFTEETNHPFVQHRAGRPKERAECEAEAEELVRGMEALVQATDETKRAE